MARIPGKVTIITGAGLGIGRAMALRFAAEGARVIAADINGEQQHVAAAAQGEVEPFHCDVSQPDQVAALIEFCRSRYGRLDVLCNNAGISNPPAPLHEITLEQWDRVMNINVRGAFLVLKHAIPLLLASGGGAVVNTASIGSFRATRGSGAYITSKGAIKMLTQVAALDYVLDNIRVNAICPGTVQTPMVEAASAEQRAFLTARTPMGRLATPEEVAALALFLASDEASHITGASYLIDGGRSAG